MYFAFSKEIKNPKKAVIILSDIFGIFINSQLLADQFASQGYIAVPDLFDGDSLPLDALTSDKVDFGAWFSKHNIDAVASLVKFTLEHVRDKLGIRNHRWCRILLRGKGNPNRHLP